MIFALLIQFVRDFIGALASSCSSHNNSGHVFRVCYLVAGRHEPGQLRRSQRQFVVCVSFPVEFSVSFFAFLNWFVPLAGVPGNTRSLITRSSLRADPGAYCRLGGQDLPFCQVGAAAPAEFALQDWPVEFSAGVVKRLVQQRDDNKGAFVRSLVLIGCNCMLC